MSSSLAVGPLKQSSSTEPSYLTLASGKATAFTYLAPRRPVRIQFRPTWSAQCGSALGPHEESGTAIVCL